MPESSRARLLEQLLHPDPARPRVFSMGPAEIELDPRTVGAALDYFGDGMMNPRGQDFKDMLAECRNNVAELAGLVETHEIAFVTGSGSNAAQAMCAAVRKDDRIALLQTGTYSKRLEEAFIHGGGNVFVFDATAGRAVDLDQFDQFVSDNKCNLVVFIAGPTDTTNLTPVYEICNIAADRDCDIMIDTISTFGGEPSEFLADHAGRMRAVTIGLNKALRCGVVGANACLAVRRDSADDIIARHDDYLWAGGSEDLKSILEFHRQGMHKQTMSPLALALVRAATRDLLASPGALASLIREYRLRSAVVRRELMGLGLRIYRHESAPPLMAIGATFHLPDQFSNLGEFMRALASRPVGGRRFDIYGEADNTERLRFFVLGHPGAPSRELEERARATELERAEAAGDAFAMAYYRGESLAEFSLEERAKLVLAREEHALGTYTEFIEAVSQALA